MSETEVKNQVRQFYNKVGWQMLSDGFYQNARYEDLRPVSKEYIHRCHMRINRHIHQTGRFLLDAGSGPVQYPEYLTYSEGYQFRVCVDISIVALQEARQRVADRGLYVVADVAHLPFKEDVFDAEVSLHTLHHLPAEDKKPAYLELYRVLAPGKTAAVVNGWTESGLMRSSFWYVRLMEIIGIWIAEKRGKQEKKQKEKKANTSVKEKEPTGTYIQKLSPEWMRAELSELISYQVWVWRSVNVRFLRAIFHRPLAGKFFLRVLYQLEELAPHFFGKHGQYPLIVISKPENR
ncbi:MAG: class I SAM-dependent methyltransferase [Anaerolineaceae bacterium]|nr:class I SAM-dependent methyltransferase [Anaerolineaceae bacterium]